MRLPSPVFICLVTGWLALLVAGEFLPRLEGSFFPVVANAKLVAEMPDNTSDIRVFGSMETLRHDCDFISMEWQVRMGVDIETLSFDGSGAIIRDRPKRLFFGPMKITFSEATDKILSPDAEFLVTHRCHPFWNTITKVQQ